MAIIVFTLVAIHFHKATTVDNGRRLSRLMRMTNWFILALAYLFDIMISDRIFGVSPSDFPPLFERALFRLAIFLVVLGEIAYYGDAVWDIALGLSGKLRNTAANISAVWNRKTR